MENTNWLKQNPEKPLFPDLLWSKPENKAQAGKLLIVGGNSHGFSAPAAAFSASQEAGVGTARVLLPDSLQKTLGKSFSEAKFALTTPSGSFARTALADLLEEAEWADGILLAGDFGKNSETAVLLESFVSKHKGLLVLTGDAAEYFLQPNTELLDRKDTLLILDIGQLQKLAKHNRPTTPVLHSMNLSDLVTVLADWTNGNTATFITKSNNNLVVANGGRVSTTSASNKAGWQVELAAYASVWWLQNPSKPFEAMTSAVFAFSSYSNDT